MRILLWSEDFWPYLGGIEVLAATFVTSLQVRGHEVQVVTRKNSDELPDEAEYGGVPVHRFPLWTTLLERNVDRMLQVSRQVADLKRTFRPDVVHVNGVRVGVFFHHHTYQAHRAPVVVTLHDTPPERFSGPETVLESTLRTATWVTACSSAMLEEVRRRLPAITSYSSVILNGLAAPDIPVEPVLNDLPTLLCVGRLVPQKGFDLALDALRRLVVRGRALRLLIAGDGPARPHLEQQVAELGLREVVDFLGWVPPDDVYRLMNSETIVVVPSREESFGLVALQAAQMARPVVATRVGGLPEIILHGSTGLLVEPEQSSSISAAIELLLDSPDTTRQMGQLARTRAQQLFSWDGYMDAYEQLYRQVIRESQYVEAS